LSGAKARFRQPGTRPVDMFALHLCNENVDHVIGPLDKDHAAVEQHIELPWLDHVHFLYPRLSLRITVFQKRQMMPSNTAATKSASGARHDSHRPVPPQPTTLARERYKTPSSKLQSPHHPHSIVRPPRGVLLPQ